MRLLNFVLAIAFLASFGAAQACPDQSSNQTKSSTVEKPLAPKPSA